VVIPNGSYSWTTGITCAKAIKIMGASIGGVTILDNLTSGSLIELSPQAGGILEFCNIILRQGPAQSTRTTQTFIVVDYAPGSQPMLLHDCSFYSSGLMLQHILWQQNGGVIWNCLFNGGYVEGSNVTIDVAFQFKYSAADLWRTPSTMGTADVNGTANTYIEDCTFQQMCLECINCDDGSRTVFRHNSFQSCPIGSHGQDTSPLGTRHWEVYNNTFSFDGVSNLQYYTAMRGGTGIIANNIMPVISSMAWGTKSCVAFACLSVEIANRCFSNYPIPRQVGQSWSGGAGSYSYVDYPADGSGYITDPVYVWGNTGTGNYNTIGYFDNTNACGNGLSSSSVIVAGRDVLYGTAKPGYTPYTYPHPLRASPPTPVSTPGSTPPAPQNLRVVTP
jgi:hypothetical protein